MDVRFARKKFVKTTTQGVTCVTCVIMKIANIIATPNHAKTN
jgi:hypothetical protein